MDLSKALSSRLGPLGPRVEEMVRTFGALWNGCGGEDGGAGRTYSRAERKAAEGELAAAVERLSSAWTDLGGAQAGAAPDRDVDPARFEALIAAVKPNLLRVLDRLELPLRDVYDARMVDATRAFLREARAFDPGLDPASVYQALRNVWIINTLQGYLGVEVELTGAVFGYSLIYPYLDNLLDDQRVGVRDKIALLDRLRGWLEDAPGVPADDREARLRELVTRIESRFPRAAHPGVFGSLLAIFNAQVRSLAQQAAEGAPDDAALLAISFEKGGTSVVADGYLAAGTLSPRQEEFCFALGTILQLDDDLQDLAEDGRRGHRTLFTAAAARGERLDALVLRLRAYTAAALGRTLDPARPAERRLGAIVRRACDLMVLETAGKHGRAFTRRGLRRFQAELPFRFRWLRRLRRRLADRFGPPPATMAELDPAAAVLNALSARAFSLD